MRRTLLDSAVRRAPLTITDLLQAIVGDVPASTLASEPLAVRRDDGSWLIDGMMPAYEFKELLDVRRLPHEEDGSFTTVGGFVMRSLGKVPRTGDHFECCGWRFEVVDMDSNRVDEVLVSPLRESRAADVVHEPDCIVR